MSDSVVVNNTVLDYSTIKYFNVPYSNTVKFYSGVLFPNNKNFVRAIWDFGDNTTLTTYFSSNSARYTKAVNALADSASFFPRWADNLQDGTGLVIPRFETNHVYNTPGTYKVNVLLIDSNGVSYTGQPVEVTITGDTQPYVIPSNWSAITTEYVTSNNVYLLSKLGTPIVNANYSTTSALPIDVAFNITNLVGRTDIDYIEWNFGDGTSSVTTTKGGPIIQQFVEINYSYKLIPTQLVYEPQVILYFSNKQKIKLQVPQIPLVITSNISVGVNENNNNIFNDTPLFNITPTQSSTLPVDADFIQIIPKKLKYIIWNYDDGVYDVIPVSYTDSISNILQTITTKHKYTSVNYYNYIPKCLFMFENEDGTFDVQSFRSKKYLNYQLGVINPTANYFNTSIVSITNYKKIETISCLVEYPPTNTGYATVYLRVNLGIPKQILYFEKIVWTVNDETIITDKNTSKDFGTLTLNNVPTHNDIDNPLVVTATVYGIPAIFADIPGNNALVFYDSYQATFYVIDKDVQEAINADSIAELLLPTPEQPTIIQTSEGIEIITPIIDTDVEVIVEEAPTYIGSTLIFDTLFKADNPAGNFLNRLYPSTASVPSDILVSKRVIGFFRPSKTSPVIVDPGDFTFTLNLESLEYNKPYYIPDPYKYGSNSDVLTFNSLDQSFKKNARFGKARNEPNQPQDSVSYYGYNSNATTNNLQSVYDSGYVHNEKRDLFGNTYGLVKDNNNFRQNINLEPVTEVYTLQLNGYKFYDDIFGEANNFNYTLTGTLGNETIRSGLSSFTNGLTGRPDSFYLLNFGDFVRKSKFAIQTEIIDINTQYLNPINVAIRDGGYFALSETNLLPDSISSDLSTFPGSGTYYYSKLYEAGANSAVPYVRPLLSTIYKSQSAIFTQNVRVSANNGVIDVDGGRFETNFNINDNYFTLGDIPYVDSVNPTTVTSFVSSLSVNYDTKAVRDNLSGSILIRDTYGNVDSILNKLSYLQTKYTPTVYSSLTSNIVNFDLIYNTYCIQTGNYVIFDKINYTQDGYVNPKTPNIAVSYNNNLYNTASNRYKVGSNVYFATLSTYGDVTSSQAFVYPVIYKIDIYTLELQQIFPATANISAYSADFAIDTDNVLYVEAGAPYITYNSDVELFNISYLLKDQNKLPYLMSVYFKDKQDNIIDSTYGFRFGVNNTTTQFTTLTSINSFNTLLSSSAITTITSALIL